MQDLPGWIPIFATGRWGGVPITEDSLTTMVESFHKLKGIINPPVKLGHAEDQTFLKNSQLPAAGWISDIKKVGNQILARVTNVPDIIADLIKKKLYAHVSAEVLPSYSYNGQEFGWVLYALAFLGVECPAVRNLGDLSAIYGDNPMPVKKDFSGTVYCFSDNNGTLTMTMPTDIVVEKKVDPNISLLKFADGLCNRLFRIGTVIKFAGTSEGVKKAWLSRQRAEKSNEEPGLKVQTPGEKAAETKRTPSAEKTVGEAFKVTKGLSDTEKSMASQWKDVPLTDLQKLTADYGKKSGGFEKYVPKAKTDGWSKNKLVANGQVGALEGRANAMVKKADGFPDIESKRVLHAFALFLREKAATISKQRDDIK